MDFTGAQLFKNSVATFATPLQNKTMEPKAYTLNTYKIEWQKK